ncbi:CAP domain-containing protein [Corynebacterium epidermidicanis]|uniref:SCP domain-containing protein n=1 Tax=Corynebacterium epidermidicanis TaxID=1050174 RepID=A0A0G3GRP8_9CORY|nr:CAP domain-containing protein [Corynebacterium epidermidicanis]AKK02208.1 hypothetical protein CEPID_01615 [Corynebacterium epidermidicanis]
MRLSSPRTLVVATLLSVSVGIGGVPVAGAEQAAGSSDPAVASPAWGAMRAPDVRDLQQLASMLGVAAVVTGGLAGILAAGGTTPATPAAPDSPSEKVPVAAGAEFPAAGDITTQEGFRAAMYQEIQATRRAHGLDADGSYPTRNLTHEASAQKWANYLASTGTQSHDPNFGKTVELLGPGATPREVVAMWLGSAPHREELLRENLYDYGIGVARLADGDWMVVYRGTPDFVATR